MRIIDASSIVYAWDNYPIGKFPKLWDWLKTEIDSGELAIPHAAYEEVTNVSPDCAAWLHANECKVIAETNAILNKAMEIKATLDILNDQYHPDGVGENDILIISTAQVHGYDLVSNESKQNNLPAQMKRYKIPAVCAIDGVEVNCEDFRDYFNSSDEVFG